MAARKKAKLSNRDDVDAHDNSAVSKSSKNTRRSRKGCLENVQALPLDVSLQIFGYLHPKDLLNLTRTSKAFRAFFLNLANSISIWKSSLRRVDGLPEKPESISEPAFAHLVFSSFCQNCGKFGAQNPIWAWFVRYCMECTETMLIRSGRFLKFRDPDPNLQGVVRRHGFKLFNVCHPPGHPFGWVIHKSQFDNFIQEWKKIGGNDEDSQKALVEKQCKATEERAMVRQQFAEWHAAEKRHRIMARLQYKDSEWLPEMQHFERFLIRCQISNIPAVRQPKRLTDRAWPKVLAALREEMNELREIRLEEERGTKER